MRAATSGELAVLAGVEFKPIFRVKIKDSTGTWRDYSTLGAANWIHSVTIDANIDQPIAGATIVLWRGDTAASSLSPLMTLSAYAGYIDIGRDVRIETGAIAAGGVPVESDYKLLFEGVIDDYDQPGNSELQLNCRDHGALLEDQTIETESVYGSGAGVALETVIQQILDNNLAAAAPVLYTPVSPAFLVKTFKQPAGESIFEAIGKLARAKDGWDVRYKYDAGTGTFRLTLYAPARSKSVADFTFDAGDEFKVTRFQADRTQVRNVIVVSYNDSATGTVQKVTLSDAASITKYKRRALQVDATGLPITTASEANAYGSAILTDMKEPKADREADMPFFWPAELGDLYDYAPNSTHNDTTQKLAAVSLRHELSASTAGATARTKIGARGAVAGAFNLWLVLEKLGIVYVEPSWTEQITEPSEGVARITLANVKDPQSRLISITWNVNGVISTDNAPGPYEVDAALLPFDPLPVTYTVRRYDVLGIIREDVYTIVLPISGAKLAQDLSTINLLDAPGFYVLARTEQLYNAPTATFSVELQKLAPIIAAGDRVSGLMRVRGTNTADSVRVKIWFTDGAGTTLGTLTGLTYPLSEGLKQTVVVGGHAAPIPANTHKIHIATEPVGVLAGQLYVYMPSLCASAVPWNAAGPQWYTIVLELEQRAGNAVALVTEQATRNGVRGVQGDEDLAMDMYDATGATKIVDAVTRQLLSMLLGSDVTDANARAIARMLAKGNTADPDNIDSVPDGTLNGKTLLTALTSGQIDLSKAGVINKILANIARSGGDATTAATILQYIANSGHAGASMQNSVAKLLNLLYAKTNSADPDTADSVATGAVKQVTTINEATGANRAYGTHKSTTALKVGTDIEDALGVDRDLENVRDAQLKAAFQAGVAYGTIQEQLTRDGVRGVAGSEALALDLYDTSGVTRLLDASSRTLLDIFLKDMTDSVASDFHQVRREILANALFYGS